jgi:hypothetical protein
MQGATPDNGKVCAMDSTKIALQKSMAVLQRHWKKILGAIGVSAAGDILKEYGRGKAMDWVIDRLGLFGTWLIVDKFSLLSLCAVMSVLFAGGVFLYYEFADHESLLVGTEHFIPPRFSFRFKTMTIAVLLVMLFLCLFGWHKYYAFMNNTDHARLEIVGIKRLPRGTQPGVDFPVYRVFYVVKGKQAEVGFMSREMVMTPDHVLTDVQMKHQFEILYDLPTEETEALYSDENQIFPDEHHVRFISVPEGAGGGADTLNAESDNIVTGRKYLYILTALFYRDAVMPANIHAITMNCARFHGSLDLYDDCGNRTFLTARR